jgi:hypothetical protein
MFLIVEKNSKILIVSNLTLINIIIFPWVCIKEFIEALAGTFKTRIQILGLNWKEEQLLKVCNAIYPTPPKKNVVASVSGYPPIEALLEKNWIKII